MNDQVYPWLIGASVPEKSGNGVRRLVALQVA